MVDGPAAAAQTLSGTVERIVYHDERSRYTVMRMLVAGHETLVTAVGRTRGLEPGADVTVLGQWDEHPTHGRQFSFGRVHVEVPTTLPGIVRRLMRFPGVKEVMANRIVQRFGMDTLEIIDKQPRRLLEVEGIGQRTLDKIVEHQATQNGPVAEIEAQLLELDMPAYLADALHERYGAEAIAMIRQRPYRLAREVRGIGFATADRIARAQGLAIDSDERIDAGVLHLMEQAEQDGNCALPVEQLVERAARSLGVSQEAVRDAGDRLVRLAELVLERGADGTTLCFVARLVKAERAIARRLAALAHVGGAADEAGQQRPWIVRDIPQHLSPGQIEAVKAVADHGVTVLTGGPGTGKSTVVHAILAMAEANGVDVHLAAPTGRAAKRLEQATGHAASTVHRLLEFQPETARFTYGDGNPLDPGLVVVDESSMLDLTLCRALLEALDDSHRLLLVGDADQLPSVGAGNVLRDIMQVAEHPDTPICLVRLTEVFRQAEGSSIVANAHRILSGQMPKADPKGDSGEFFVIPARSPEHAHELIVRLATERIPEAFGFDGQTQVQVLCPMHKGRGGTEAINRTLQEHHTAGHPELVHRGAGGTAARRFRRGDRVMQLRNDYEKGVFNGDVGVVVKASAAEKELVVDMDGQRVRYQGKEMMALQLAYAVSIHKSQGSEFEAVICSILPEHHIMLRRNLLYTAVTRAKKLCVVVGDPRAIERAVRRIDSGRRHTGLARRVFEALGEFCEPDEAPVPKPSTARSEPKLDHDPFAFRDEELPSLEELIGS